MKHTIVTVTATALALVTPHVASAALAPGGQAPALSAQGALNGKMAKVELSAMLEKGPVVLFWFPSVYSDGEVAREFAEKAAAFEAAGASVLGMSRDSVDALREFSVSEAKGKFPVASADLATVDAFDVNDGAMFNTRTTYVIAHDGRIAFVEESSNLAAHVAGALAAVQELAGKHESHNQDH